MRTSSKLSVGIAFFVLGMIWGSFSHAQETKPEKPADPATLAKPAELVIPEGLTANLNTTFYSKRG